MLTAKTDFRILTINIHKGFSPLSRRFVLPELREAVRATDADLVFLQEVVGASSRWAARYPGWPVDSQYEYLAEGRWSGFAYGKNVVSDTGHRGNAILARKPISHRQNIDVSINGAERRALLHCRIGAGTGAVHAVCVHLGLTEAHRRFQLRGLEAMIDRYVPAMARLIVAGDFNDWRGLAHRFMEDQLGMREVCMQCSGVLPRTFPARRPVLRLDRIYLRNFRQATALKVPKQPWSSLSDHLPVIVSATP